MVTETEAVMTGAVMTGIESMVRRFSSLGFLKVVRFRSSMEICTAGWLTSVEEDAVGSPFPLTSSIECSVEADRMKRLFRLGC